MTQNKQLDLNIKSVTVDQINRGDIIYKNGSVWKCASKGANLFISLQTNQHLQIKQTKYMKLQKLQLIPMKWSFQNDKIFLDGRQLGLGPTHHVNIRWVKSFPQLDLVVQQKQKELTNQKNNQKDYDTQVIQVSNIALAIRNKQQTINVQLCLRCENLPTSKAFAAPDSMIVVLKSDQLPKQNGMRKFIQIGRTQIVYNQINPKYIKTFIFPSKGEDSQQLQFRVYHIIDRRNYDDLKAQRLFGKVNINLHSLIDSQKQQAQIRQNSKSNTKSILKMYCSQYQGGNSFQQIQVQTSYFNSIAKTQISFIIQTLKYGGVWIPIYKSQKGRAYFKFQKALIPFTKFQQQNPAIKIRFYDQYKNQQIGCTRQLAIDQLNQNKIHSQRVSHGGFNIAQVSLKCNYKQKQSFISYIVGGSRLNLLLGIDFTNSNNQNGQSLHKLNQKGQNVYTNAIKQIVGVLQYFSVQNQVALYGFGAKLPPFYKSVSQCFALNGNYFSPNVQGGADQIIKLYKQNLEKIKLYGPTCFSQIIQLAIKYAQQQQKSKPPTYCVLLIITDGKINDFQDTKNLINQIQNLPLSIMFVGVNCQSKKQIQRQDIFESLKKLQKQRKIDSQNKDKFILVNQQKKQKNDKVDIIIMSDHDKDQTSQSLARQAFDQIPNHFVQYMKKKGIKPLRDKKNIKAAKAQFIAQKIKSNPQKKKNFNCSFLQKQKRQMKKKLVNLGFSNNDPMIQNMSIAMNDLSYFIQVHSQTKKIQTQQVNQKKQFINTKQVKTLQKYLDKKDQQKKIRILQKLQRIQGNQYGKRIKSLKKQQQIIKQQMQQLNNPCVQCKQKQINIMHMNCRHCSVCQNCYTNICPICNFQNYQYRQIKFDKNGKLIQDDDDYNF